METWDAIRSRRNVRQFADRAIPDEVLDQILEAGRRTPSSRNDQPWDFVVVTDRTTLEELSGVWRGAGHIARSAATIALVAPTTTDPHQRESIQYDMGQLTMMLMLAATDRGLGSAHGAVADQELARQVLGLPADRELAWLLALGYPAEGELKPLHRVNRRPFDDLVHRERW